MDSSRRADPGGGGRVGGFSDGGEEVKLVQEGTLRHGRFPARAPVLIDEDDARGGGAPPRPLSAASRMIDDNVKK